MEIRFYHVSVLRVISFFVLILSKFETNTGSRLVFDQLTLLNVWFVERMQERTWSSPKEGQIVKTIKMTYVSVSTAILIYSSATNRCRCSIVKHSLEGYI